MSYSIVFETKIAILSDGRLIHFSRTGCNNDSEGRLASDFRAEILTAQELLDRINEYTRMKMRGAEISKRSDNCVRKFD